jgi:branched-chain amino acid transport system permease protein
MSTLPATAWERLVYRVRTFLLDTEHLGRDLLVLVALAGWALALPHYGSEFVVSMALTCLMYVALATSWTLFCGTTRYLSLATAAFFGLGAYTSALFIESWGWLAVIGAGAGVAAIVAIVMGSAVLHLRGTYFAVLTFGMTELIRHAISYWEKQVSGTVGRVLTVAPERDTVYLTMLGLAVLAVAVSIVVRRTRFGLGLMGIGADEQRAQTLGVDTRVAKIGGFALTAAFAGAVGAAMSVRWTYIDPATVFNPFIGFQTVLIALIGGVATLWGPLIAAIVFSLLAESLRLQPPQLYLITHGLLLILSVLYLPGGLASLRWSTLRQWRDDLRDGWKNLRDPKRREERRERKARKVRVARQAAEAAKAGHS